MCRTRLKMTASGGCWGRVLADRRPGPIRTARGMIGWAEDGVPCPGAHRSISRLGSPGGWLSVTVIRVSVGSCLGVIQSRAGEQLGSTAQVAGAAKRWTRCGRGRLLLDPPLRCKPARSSIGGMVRSRERCTASVPMLLDTNLGNLKPMPHNPFANELLG
jgi:hypothetical protein